MNILFLGDLVGENCVHFLKKNLRNICVKYNINLVITNAENVAGGYGITPDISNNSVSYTHLTLPTNREV